MPLIDLITLLAVAQYLFFAMLVGRARVKHGVQAPAVTGHEMFERAYRVQMNTLELLVLFLPALYLAGRHWAPVPAAIGGGIYLVGRFIYWNRYMAAPERRSLGFALSILPCMVLWVGALVGVVRAL
jgi:hypothetical protein